MRIGYRILISVLVLGGIVVCYRLFFQSNRIVDKLDLTSISVHKIYAPKTVDELRHIVQNTKRPIALAGERYSQGGQIAYPQGIVIDMSYINNLIDLDVSEKKVTIQSGATWRDLQEIIDPYNLSVKAMQSYADFSIGGSLSVNVHGRDLEHAPLAHTVESMSIMLANGLIVQASRTEHTDLFSAALGGYGLLGVIIDVTLSLTDNVVLERVVHSVPLRTYTDFFLNRVKHDPNTVFHNADLWPPNFTQTLAVTWRKVDKEPTVDLRLQSQSIVSVPGRLLEIALRRSRLVKQLRPLIETELKKAEKRVWRNYEMSYSVDDLAIHLHAPTTMTLQEYFVPIDALEEFITKLRVITRKYKVNILNLSIRHVPQDRDSLLAYAPQESFALVLYLNVLNTVKGRQRLCEWTQKMTDAVLSVDGSYYLPYVMCATWDQMRKAYPQWNTFLEVKKRYDPEARFRNMLYKHYA